MYVNPNPTTGGNIGINPVYPQHVCPHCGRCRHCGQGAQQPPYYPQRSDKCPYPLEFCRWLHRNFDGLVEAINSHRLFEFETW